LLKGRNQTTNNKINSGVAKRDSGDRCPRAPGMGGGTRTIGAKNFGNATKERKIPKAIAVPEKWYSQQSILIITDFDTTLCLKKTSPTFLPVT